VNTTDSRSSTAPPRTGGETRTRSISDRAVRRCLCSSRARNADPLVGIVNDGEVLVEFVCLIPKAALTAYYIGRAAERSASEAL
jgi:hypothetical protein